MQAIAGGGTETLLAGVQGLTPAIQKAGTLAYRVANMQAYRTVFYVSIAFGGLAMLISFWIPNVDDKMSGSVAATLGNQSKTATEKRVDGVVE
jgi:hypothetical protein